jgi:hypothetical protein
MVMTDLVLSESGVSTRQLSPPSLLRRIRRGLLSALDWVLGALALWGLLAFCSVIPVLNFLSLGYLMEASARVGRGGRCRDGFIGVRKATVLGTMVAGVWLVTWPVKLVAVMWRDAELIQPGGAVARGWYLAVWVLLALTFVHVLWACARGGKLIYFLWPRPFMLWRWLREGQQWQQMQASATNYVLGLRLPHYLWLGLLGFVGASLWLIVPVGLLLVATRLPDGGAIVVSLLGSVLLFWVALHLPFLQARLAVTGDWAAVLHYKEVRRMFGRAPWAFWLALLVTLLLALPLYLLKIELTPKELAWAPSLLFVVLIFPARVLTGWALARAGRRKEPRGKWATWTARLAILPVGLAYVLAVYFTPYFSWNGVASLLEQHAFLVPAPLMAL